VFGRAPVEVIGALQKWLEIGSGAKEKKKKLPGREFEVDYSRPE